MGVLISNKVKLVEWLSSDLHILQHAHSDGLIDHRVYRNLTKTPQLTPEAACIQLIDTITGGGEGTSAQFLQLLKQPEILVTYPQLKDWDPSLVPQRPSAVPGRK